MTDFICWKISAEYCKILGGAWEIVFNKKWLIYLIQDI